MWTYERRLEYPVNIKTPNAKLAKVIISQLGGPDGELGAAMRYLSQRYSNTNRKVAGVLTDIGTEELAHMEMICAIVHQLTKNLNAKELEEQGFAVTYLPVDAYGCISLQDLKDAMCSDTILVSIMHVNNEIGAVQPVEEAARLIKQTNPNCLFHVDAIQSYGKFRIYPKRMGIDLLSVSGHKIHGPKGSGFLFVRDKVKVHPLILGGGQERGLRSGTENVPAIAGLGQAAMEIYQNFDAKIMQMYRLRDYFIAEVEKIDGVSVNGHKDHSNAPHIVSVSVSGVRSEVLLHALEDREIYVSAGSACSSNKPAVSRTLQSIGLKRELLESTVRFSFSVHTTKEEIDYALEAMAELVPMLAKYRRS